MVLPLPAFSGVPSGSSAVLDMTADFAPFLQTGLLVGLGIVILAAITAIHDTWWKPRKAQKETAPSVSKSDFPKAA